MSDSEWRPEDLRELAKALARDTGWSDDDCDMLREAASEIDRLRRGESMYHSAVEQRNDAQQAAAFCLTALRDAQNEAETRAAHKEAARRWPWIDYISQ